MAFFTSKEATAKITGLEARIAELEADAEARDAEIDNLNEASKTKDQEIASLNEKLQGAENAKAEAEAAAKIASDKQAEAEKKLSTFDAEVEKSAIAKVAAQGVKTPISEIDDNGTGEKKTRAEFDAMSYKDRNAFIERGGKVVAG